MIETKQMNYNYLDRLGFRLEGFSTWSLEKSLKTLAKIGYKSVELCLEHPDLDPEAITSEKINTIRKYLEDLNLRVSAISKHCRDESVDSALLKQKRGLELARDLNCGILVVGTVEESMDSEGLASSKALEELLRAAEGTGVIVALEPEPDTVINGMYEFSQFASRLAGAPLGLNLDVGHCFLTEGDPSEVIDEWAPFIVHTHIADIRRPDHIHLLPGDGHIDLNRLFWKLKEHGYLGEYVIDLYDITDAPDQWAQKALERCREILV